MGSSQVGEESRQVRGPSRERVQAWYRSKAGGIGPSRGENQAGEMSKQGRDPSRVREGVQTGDPGRGEVQAG